MKRIFYLTFLFLFSVTLRIAPGLYAQEFADSFFQDWKRIRFHDGSEVKGKIFDNADPEMNTEDQDYSYHIQTEKDEYDVDYYDVAAVELWTDDRPLAKAREVKTLPPEILNDPKYQAMMQNFQARMFSDPTLMNDFMAISEDPELKEIFEDPQFNMVLADYYDHHDISEIKKYSHSKKLLSNAQAMDVIERITRK